MHYPCIVCLFVSLLWRFVLLDPLTTMSPGTTINKHDMIKYNMRKRRTAHRFGDKRRTNDVFTEEKVDFSGLMLSEDILLGLQSAGFQRPSPIQLKAIPLGRCGLDLIAQAKSGTGKTCVFSVIALENVNVAITAVQVLILAPTREIAVQIKEVLCSIGRHVENVNIQVFIGGLPIEADTKSLKQCHIAIGTPGRVKHLIENKSLTTEKIRLFILDEADKLLDESFQTQTNWIYSTLPASKQMLALSATYTDELAQHLKKYMKDPTFVRLNASDASLQGIFHYHCVVPFHSLPHKVFQNKVEKLMVLLSNISFHQCLIFSNYQIRARNLSETLEKHGWPSTYISGNQEQSERLKAMEKLKEYKCRILISTDLTSRGIDAERVNLVVNMDVTRDSETYLHRVGRAGRFGSYGAAVNFVARGDEFEKLKEIAIGCGLVMNTLPDDVSEILTFDNNVNDNANNGSEIGRKIEERSEEKEPKELEDDQNGGELEEKRNSGELEEKQNGEELEAKQNSEKLGEKQNGEELEEKRSSGELEEKQNGEELEEKQNSEELEEKQDGEESYEEKESSEESYELEKSSEETDTEESCDELEESSDVLEATNEDWFFDETTSGRSRERETESDDSSYNDNEKAVHVRNCMVKTRCHNEILVSEMKRETKRPSSQIIKESNDLENINTSLESREKYPEIQNDHVKSWEVYWQQEYHRQTNIISTYTKLYVQNESCN